MKKKQLLASVLLCTSLLAVTGCGKEESQQNNQEQSSEQSIKKEEKKKNDDDYNREEDFIIDNKTMTSPINIDTKKTTKTDAKNKNDILLNINPHVSSIKTKGNTIEVKTTGEATINGRHYTLEGFHIHVPSVHTVDKKHYPAEIHFITKAHDGQYSVITVFANQGKENKAMTTIMKNLKENKHEAIPYVQTLFPNDMKHYYHYVGTLSTPQLSKEVAWYIMKSPIHFSKQQLNELKAFYKTYDLPEQDQKNQLVEENQ